MMGTNAAAVSIDRFRRRTRKGVAATQLASAPAPAQHPLVGMQLGSLARRYGLMSSQEFVAIADVIATSGDLAVADRLAFVAAMERRAPVVVVQLDGWYIACATDRPLEAAQLTELQPVGEVGPSQPRIMSLVTDRGITPALGPLVA